MRICPVSIIQPRTNIQQTQKINSTPTLTTPAFKGWKAGLGSLLGAGAGLIIGSALSGGLLTPFILGGIGSIGGGIAGSSKEKPEEPDDDYTPDWHLRD